MRLQEFGPGFTHFHDLEADTHGAQAGRGGRLVRPRRGAGLHLADVLKVRSRAGSPIRASRLRRRRPAPRRSQRSSPTIPSSGEGDLTRTPRAFASAAAGRQEAAFAHPAGEAARAEARARREGAPFEAEGEGFEPSTVRSGP